MKIIVQGDKLWFFNDFRRCDRVTCHLSTLLLRLVNAVVRPDSWGARHPSDAAHALVAPIYSRGKFSAGFRFQMGTDSSNNRAWLDESALVVILGIV